MKRVLSVLLSLCLVVLALPAAGALSVDSMTDVPAGQWYYNAVSYCLEKGYMSGEGKGIFSPGGNVTRAQVAQVLWNREGNPSTAGYSDPFSDVAERDWFYQSVLWCSGNKVVNGVGAGTFAPLRSVSRQDLCVMVYRYFTEYLGRSPRLASMIRMIQTFTDWSQTDTYARDAVRWAVDSGFMNGTSSTTIEPKETVTRAQLAQFLKNLDRVLSKSDPDPESEPEYKLGVDISVHNGDVDFELLKSLGVEFVAIRCGYGGNYADQDDIRFEENIRKAEAAGIPWGTYLYSYATDADMAQDEAEHVFRLLKGRNPVCGVWYDVEDPTQMDSDLTTITETFCDIMEEAGLSCGIYSYRNLFRKGLDDDRLDRFPKWVAQWSRVCEYEKPYIAWQFSNKFVIRGVDFDGDVAYRGFFGLDFGEEPPVVDPDDPDNPDDSDDPNDPDSPGNPDNSEDPNDSGGQVESIQSYRLRSYSPPAHGPANETDRVMGDGYRVLNRE